MTGKLVMVEFSVMGSAESLKSRTLGTLYRCFASLPRRWRACSAWPRTDVTLPSRGRECRACLGDDAAPSRAVTFASFFHVPEPDLLFRFYAFSPLCLILIRFKSNRLLPFSDEPLAATPRPRTHLTSTTAPAINPLHNLALSQARLLHSTTPFFKKPSPSTHRRRLKLTSTPYSIPQKPAAATDTFRL